MILYREMEQRDTPLSVPNYLLRLLPTHLPWMFTLYQPSGNRRTRRRARGCCAFVLCITVCVPLFLGKDIVFRFIIECSSLRDFGPQVSNRSLFNMKIFERWYFWLVLKLEISYYRVSNILKDFGFFQTIFLKVIFLHHEIFDFP